MAVDVMRQISNTKKIKKMSHKQRSKLMKADTVPTAGRR